MTTKKIYELLLEASNPETDSKRINEIHKELYNGVSNGIKYGQHQRLDGVSCLMELLYTDVVVNNRALLPSLLPAFALICGDKGSNSLLSDFVDWEFINELHNKEKECQ